MERSRNGPTTEFEFRRTQSPVREDNLHAGRAPLPWRGTPSKASTVRVTDDSLGGGRAVCPRSRHQIDFITVRQVLSRRKRCPHARCWSAELGERKYRHSRSDRYRRRQTRPGSQHPDALRGDCQRPVIHWGHGRSEIAYESKSGKLLRETKLPANAYANPITYSGQGWKTLRGHQRTGNPDRVPAAVSPVTARRMLIRRLDSQHAPIGDVASD